MTSLWLQLEPLAFLFFTRRRERQIADDKNLFSYEGSDEVCNSMCFSHSALAQRGTKLHSHIVTYTDENSIDVHLIYTLNMRKREGKMQT